MKINEVIMKFVEDCGGVEFVRMIASGFNPCANQNIVAAAKATICRIEQIEESEGSEVVDTVD